MNRRAYLKYMGFLTLAGCGSAVGPLPRSIKFGLGDDPEKMINAYDPDGRRVLEALKPNIVCTWLNGGRDTSGRIYSPSMDYFREWAVRRRFEEWSSAGYELMIITWENYDGQNPLLGSPTFGDYHISAQFLEDLKELLGYLRAQFSKKVYIALATEQSTYSACRYDRTCANPLAYSDRVDDVTKEYFQPLRENLLRAIRLIRQALPTAEVGLCFGGWLVKYPALWEFIYYFERAIEEGNAIFFQSMRNQKADEEGYGNPAQILDNCRFFSRWKKPLHLAHYMPSKKRADVVADDLLRMSEAAYLRELGRYLSSFSFMDYSLPKNNAYDSLQRLKAFRERLMAIP